MVFGLRGISATKSVVPVCIAKLGTAAAAKLIVVGDVVDGCRPRRHEDYVPTKASQLHFALDLDG